MIVMVPSALTSSLRLRVEMPAVERVQIDGSFHSSRHFRLLVDRFYRVNPLTNRINYIALALGLLILIVLLIVLLIAMISDTLFIVLTPENS